MKKALCIILAYAILMTVLVVAPFTVNADEKDIAETGAKSGTTGDCTWKIEGTVLTVSGNGKMGSYDSYGSSKAPWLNYLFTEAVIEKGVASIGKYAFYECKNLTKVSIPNTVTGIGNYAFNNCTGLTSVTIPDSVTKIGDSVFSGCSGLTSATIGNSVTSIGNLAFYNCAGLTSIDIPDSVTNIGYSAFSSCTWLKSVNIGNSVTSIGSGAFDGCTGLTSVHISDIGAWASISFSGSDSNPLYYARKLYLNNSLITELVIPDSVSRIANYAFRNCTSLTSIDIPASVTEIGNSAFYGCTGLTSVTITDSVERIGYSAFYNCEKLKSVTVPSSVTYIGQSKQEYALGYYYDIDFEKEFKVDGFTIYGYKATAAEYYANNNGFKFVSLEDMPTEPTQAPTQEPTQTSFDPTKTTDRAVFGDIDGDGEITITDTTYLQRYTTELPTPYPIGEKVN